MTDFAELQSAIQEQISGVDYYEGGRTEHAEKHIEALQETVATLAAVLVTHLNLDLSELEDLLPSYGSATITKRLELSKALKGA